jgi:hypothetical protein
MSPLHFAALDRNLIWVRAGITHRDPIPRLEAIDITRLRELVTDAWHMRAPAELEVEYPLVCGEGRPASIRGALECHDARITEH